jgi:2,3-dihydroxybiphenyl 1,2-dioxygenase
MSVQALGYLGIGSDALDDWSRFATRWLGMQAVEHGAVCRTFRMDDWKQRLVINRELRQGQRYVGWAVADAAALDQLAARLDQASVAVRWEPRALADQRRVAALISFADPAGNRLEAFYGPETANEPFRPGRAISGFRTGPLGMGHVVLAVPRVDLVLPFYRDLLGFRISDFIRRPVTAYFLRVNPRHHSLALFETGRASLHHLMVELHSLDDVARAMTWRSPSPIGLRRRSGGTRTTWWRRSMCAHPPTFWWSAAGAAVKSTTQRGSRWK